MLLAPAVSVAAGLGAVARFCLDLAVRRRRPGAFPTGTLLVNLTGSLLLGLTLGLAAHHHLAHGATLVVGTGFAGGYTTMSTWAWETLTLVRTGRPLLAVLNATGSVTLGLAAAAAGLGLALL